MLFYSVNETGTIGARFSKRDRDSCRVSTEAETKSKHKENVNFCDTRIAARVMFRERTALGGIETEKEAMPETAETINLSPTNWSESKFAAIVLLMAKDSEAPEAIWLK